MLSNVINLSSYDEFKIYLLMNNVRKYCNTLRNSNRDHFVLQFVNETKITIGGNKKNSYKPLFHSFENCDDYLEKLIFENLKSLINVKTAIKLKLPENIGYRIMISDSNYFLRIRKRGCRVDTCLYVLALHDFQRIEKKMLLLYARCSQSSPFYKDNFPKDMIKEIYKNL